MISRRQKGTWRGRTFKNMAEERRRKVEHVFMRLGGDWNQSTWGESNLVRQRKTTLLKMKRKEGSVGIRAKEGMCLGQGSLKVKGFYTWLSLKACALSVCLNICRTYCLCYLVVVCWTCPVRHCRKSFRKYVLLIFFIHILCSQICKYQRSWMGGHNLKWNALMCFRFKN